MPVENTGQATILIIDDTKTNIDMMLSILKEYDVIPVLSGKEAFQVLKDEKIDIILLDLMMPEMDGFEVCKRLKSEPKTAEIPVIFITAKTDDESIEKAYRIGGVDYVTKPFKPLELLARVRTHLRLQKNRMEMREKNRIQQELIHILCHDLVNPFYNLKALIELYENDPSIMDRFLGTIKTSIRNGIDVINLVRKMRALEEMKFEIDLKDENLLEITNEAVSIIQQQFDRKNLTLNIDIDKSHEVVIDKTTFINSVLNNLLTNAIKFSFPGSCINVSSKKFGSKIVLSIQDSGIGMPEHYVIDIFDASKVTNREGTNNEKGTGFGMPLVKNFITAYGGKIEVRTKEKTEDSKEHGTEFLITLDSPQMIELTE